MDNSLEALLHTRIREACLPMYVSGFHGPAAFEALKQVELELKHKAGDRRLHGARLIRQVLGSKGLHLQLSLESGQQDAARVMFDGVFRYYRNHLAHDGRNVTHVTAARILVLASELLDLLGASQRRLTDPTALRNFIAVEFGDTASFVKAVNVVDGQWFPDDITDGMFEELVAEGVSEEQWLSLLETGLIDVRQGRPDDLAIDTITSFQLSPAGEAALATLGVRAQEGDI